MLLAAVSVKVAGSVAVVMIGSLTVMLPACELVPDDPVAMLTSVPAFNEARMLSVVTIGAASVELNTESLDVLVSLDPVEPLELVETVPLAWMVTSSGSRNHLPAAPCGDEASTCPVATSVCLPDV